MRFEGAVAGVTVTFAAPHVVSSCLEIAVKIAVPSDAGVKTPESLIFPVAVE
jgi:hypothetical protein